MLLGIKCYHFISNDEVQCQTNQPLLTEIIQAWRLTLIGHIARMDDNFLAFCVLEETTRTTMDDLDKDGAEQSRLPRAVMDRRSRPGPEPTTLEAVGDQWRYALVVVQARDDDNDDFTLTHIHIHTHIVLIDILPDEPGSASCASPLILRFWDRIKLFILRHSPTKSSPTFCSIYFRRTTFDPSGIIASFLSSTYHLQSTFLAKQTDWLQLLVSNTQN